MRGLLVFFTIFLAVFSFLVYHKDRLIVGGCAKKAAIQPQQHTNAGKEGIRK